MSSYVARISSITLLTAALLMNGRADAASYGVAMPAGEAIAIDVAAGTTADYLGKPQLFSGRITEVCQAEGCWLVIENNGESARVMVKDHAFAVPKDAKGEVVVYGVLSEKSIDEKTATHLAEDSASGKPVASRELRITATAVRIAE